mmetsp:Transcript_25283/g.72061  ORF Transcript_25283/g.72061 Transcript_25283/m.72061 type:complete len:243 (+) Transcript_25283:1655-2383(+)
MQCCQITTVPLPNGFLTRLIDPLSDAKLASLTSVIIDPSIKPQNCEVLRTHTRGQQSGGNELCIVQGLFFQDTQLFVSLVQLLFESFERHRGFGIRLARLWSDQPLPLALGSRAHALDVELNIAVRTVAMLLLHCLQEGTPDHLGRAYERGNTTVEDAELVTRRNQRRLRPLPFPKFARVSDVQACRLGGLGSKICAPQRLGRGQPGTGRRERRFFGVGVHGCNKARTHKTNKQTRKQGLNT